MRNETFIIVAVQHFAGITNQIPTHPRILSPGAFIVDNILKLLMAIANLNGFLQNHHF
jgi:hypothetical protein